ncbi:hypothetical protein [Streptomyces sp. CB01580]|uniref:hypothetical protein n=2 Tax=unclassified Streptomyces TaxID=2593676 RepID=UPI00116125A5|nr:hypothetical protein [Streptomyces sp. CB01580]
MEFSPLEEKTLPISTGDPYAHVLWHQFPPVIRGPQLNIQQLGPQPVAAARSHREGGIDLGADTEANAGARWHSSMLGFRRRLHRVRHSPVARPGRIGHSADMPEIWMPQAIKADLGDHAPCDPGFPPKAIAHITADRNATTAAPQDLVPFARLQNFFTHGGKGMAPHILWDPFTGTFAQFFPATSRSKALQDAPGGTRTNRAGEVVLQIEALFFPHCRADGRVCTRLTDTPCKGWSELNAWVRSWGVPDTWPMGRPTAFVSDRSPHVWSSRGGWYAHAHVPENNHVDPGSWPAFVQEQMGEPGRRTR